MCLMGGENTFSDNVLMKETFNSDDRSAVPVLNVFPECVCVCVCVCVKCAVKWNAPVERFTQ